MNIADEWFKIRGKEILIWNFYFTGPGVRQVNVTGKDRQAGSRGNGHVPRRPAPAPAPAAPYAHVQKRGGPGSPTKGNIETFTIFKGMCHMGEEHSVSECTLHCQWSYLLVHSSIKHWVCLHGLESRSERRFKTWFGPFLIWKPDVSPCERKAVSNQAFETRRLIKRAFWIVIRLESLILDHMNAKLFRNVIRACAF